MKSTPVKGTRDYLPKETALRDYLQNTIIETYQDAGFSRISTPILEDAANLDQSEGGENLKLIFRILKRGQKLEDAVKNGADMNALSDLGLRYDLTLPLSRYFADNRNDLVTPFKVIQTDRVYRAERPQKGRLREFTQCDIDIIGNALPDAEIDLILTTAKALKRIGLADFTVKINDRRILFGLFSDAGFDPKDFERVAIIFDKQDKIGTDGVKEEMLSADLKPTAVEKLISLLTQKDLNLDTLADVCEQEVIAQLSYIMDTVKTVSAGSVPIEFSPSLVRGQGYYTGTIFEVEAKGYSGAVAGGGRYDNLIGKFLGEDIPAVGFSIGFERIFSLLTEQGFSFPNRKKKIAYFYGDGEIKKAFAEAEALRADYMVSVIARPKKLGKFLDKIEKEDFDGYVVCGQEDGIKWFKTAP